MSQIDILIVEDDAHIALALQLLISKGVGEARVTLVHDGQQALEQLQHHDYQLVISDWNMPVVSGVTLLRRMRGDACTAQVPFLMLTARGDISGAETLFDAPLTDCICKPFDNDQLLARVRSLLAGGV